MIISFLGMVEENESVTKMSASNLATVIGPNIIRAQDGKSDVQYFGLINEITEKLIKCHQELFKVCFKLKENILKIYLPTIPPLPSKWNKKIMP